jgi:hypothetical protein
MDRRSDGGTDVDQRAVDRQRGSVRAAPTLLGVARATGDGIMRNPEMALIIAIVVALLGGAAGWW